MSRLAAPASNSPTVKAKKHPTLSERLKSYRLQNGLSYLKLARCCGVSEQTAFNACAGKKLTERIAYKIEQFLAVEDLNRLNTVNLPPQVTPGRPEC